jgi:hypothetical protein
MVGLEVLRAGTEQCLYAYSFSHGLKVVTPHSIGHCSLLQKFITVCLLVLQMLQLYHTAWTCYHVTFHAFMLLKETLNGHRFRSDEDVKASVVQLFKQQPSQFFAEGIYGLMCQWGAYLSVHGFPNGFHLNRSHK